MRLLLIRHGQTPNNVLGALDTQIPGAGLTALGQRQAEAVPAALAHETLAGLYVSPLVRTHLTAAPLAAVRDISPQLQVGLEEISAGDWELDRSPEAVNAYRQSYRQWVHGTLDAALPGGEDGYTFLERYTAAIAAIAGQHRREDTVAVVSHGAAIRVFTEIAADLDRADHDGRQLRNTGMITLIGDPSQGWTMESWQTDPLGGADLLGDVSHDVTADEQATAS